MKATLKILLRNNYVTKEGKRQVCLRYTAYRQCTFIGLNISVLPQHWSEKRLAVLSGDERFLFYNELIKKMYHKADGIIIENYLKPLPVCEFISKLKDQNYGNTDFYVFIEKEIELLKASRASGTISNYNKLINTMKEWKPSLSFSEITLEYIQLYHNHEIEVGNQLSTIYKKHANFKFLIGLAIDKEMIKKNPYDKFEIKKSIKAQNNDVLTEEELQKLQTAYDEDKYKEGKNEVLREFLFSCYTSLSFAEFSEVTYGDLKLIKLKSNAEDIRKETGDAIKAAKEAAALRIRPIIMTSLAMTAGMLPMAIGFGEGGDQTSPLGRAVIGGIIASTFAVLVVLPLIYAYIQNKASIQSVSLDPDDPESKYFNENN